jgi:hypothetical protein
MCLRDSRRCALFGPVGPKTLVKISIDRRRWPFSACPDGLGHGVA